ncbi:hypothetical protein ABZY44_17815, partial [Streptomyces sp. NPDC006544]|uniref:hypothetical protein n=1 Tax=Streptomyces sp. NPDC006544 TaxID=3154583 RepID=UPI0033A0488D
MKQTNPDRPSMLRRVNAFHPDVLNWGRAISRGGQFRIGGEFPHLEALADIPTAARMTTEVES